MYSDRAVARGIVGHLFSNLYVPGYPDRRVVVYGIALLGVRPLDNAYNNSYRILPVSWAIIRVPFRRSCRYQELFGQCEAWSYLLMCLIVVIRYDSSNVLGHFGGLLPFAFNVFKWFYRGILWRFAEFL